MAATLRPAVKAYRAIARPPVAGVGRLRKIGLLGSHPPTLEAAPWDDPSWELWGHASSRWLYARAADVYFDLHPKACWTRKGKESGRYAKWLTRTRQPVYMQRVFPEVPASIEYPLDRILAEFPRRYMTSHVCFMIALALTEGVTHLGLFGCDYGADTEYRTQRGGTQYWLGIAEGRGVQLVLPKGSTILRDPPALYGYESHDETSGEILPVYRVTTRSVVIRGERQDLDLTGAVPLVTPPANLRAQIAADETHRPSWALWTPPVPILEGVGV